jgi:hypothetical protein
LRAAHDSSRTSGGDDFRQGARPYGDERASAAHHTEPRREAERLGHDADERRSGQESQVASPCHGRERSAWWHTEDSRRGTEENGDDVGNAESDERKADEARPAHAISRFETSRTCIDSSRFEDFDRETWTSRRRDRTLDGPSQDERWCIFSPAAGVPRAR